MSPGFGYCRNTRQRKALVKGVHDRGRFGSDRIQLWQGSLQAIRDSFQWLIG
jgi:hypothetical protein